MTVLLSFLLSVVAAEIVVRAVLPYNTPDTVRKYSLEFEPAVYARYMLKPVNRLVELDGAKAWGSKGKDKPSDLSVFVSANGYRGPPFDVRPPPELPGSLFWVDRPCSIMALPTVNRPNSVHGLIYWDGV